LIYGYLDARRRHFSVLMRQLLAILLPQALASTVLLAIGGWLVITGQLSLGQLVAAELIVAIVVDSFAKMAKHIESYYDLLTSVDKIGQLLDLPVERNDGLLTIPDGSGIVIQKLRLPQRLRCRWRFVRGNESPWLVATLALKAICWTCRSGCVNRKKA